VVDSRPSGDGREIKRRRECPSCSRRFTTFERLELSYPLIVKKNGERQPYDRQRVLKGLQKACEKRPVPADEMERIADGVEVALLEVTENEVSSDFVGQAVMDHLSGVDHVAYVRFASVYREFEELSDFAQAMEDLVKTRRRQRKKRKSQ
jgi:transcriptional repressor NrdR